MKLIRITSASTATKVVVVALAAMGITGGAYAAAKPSVPTPTIGAKPANPTMATNATFSFTDARAGVTFECALDTASFTACISPKAYAGPLSEGSHSFAVRARTNKGGVSSPASYAWRIDRTAPPAPTLTTTPANPTNQTTASFAFTDAESGVTFQCQLDGGAFNACASPKTYTGLSAGTHTLAVKAIDGVGLSSDTSSFTWLIDTTPPAAPAITTGPTDPTSEIKATFSFTHADGDITFECQLDTAAYTSCTSPHTANGAPPGTHTFRVRALDKAGNASPSTSYSWTVNKPLSGFTLSGNLTQPLYPGATSPVDVTITNPYHFDIYVSGITVTPQAATTKDGQPNPDCDGTVNLKVAQQYTGTAVNVPKNGTVSLSGKGVSQSLWPRLSMPNLDSNQDACKGTDFTFKYSATATKK